jgi:hypothetical protein
MWLVFHILQAIVANGYVGAYLGDAAAIVGAAQDFEGGKLSGGCWLYPYCVDGSSRRRLLADIGNKRIDLMAGSFCVNDNALQIVGDVPTDFVMMRQPVDEWPETHTLHQSCDADEL